MKIFEAGYLSKHELNINWTAPFNEKDDNENNNIDINGKTCNQRNVKKQWIDISSCQQIEYLDAIRNPLRNAELSIALVKVKVGFGMVHESD